METEKNTELLLLLNKELYFKEGRYEVVSIKKEKIGFLSYYGINVVDKETGNKKTILVQKLGNKLALLREFVGDFCNDLRKLIVTIYSELKDYAKTVKDRGGIKYDI